MNDLPAASVCRLVSLLLLVLSPALHASTPALAIQTGHVGAVVEVAWSPDGVYLASRGSSFNDGSVKVWDPASGRLLASIRPAALAGMRWSPDGARIAVWEEAGRVHIWSARDGTVEKMFETGATIRDAAWSPDGRRLAIALALSSVLFDALTWTKSATLPDVTGPLRFSHDGSRLFAGGVVWVVADGSAVSLLDGFQPNFVRLDPTSWSPDDSLIASASSKVLRVWSPADGRLLQEIPSSTHLRDLAWSPDGSMLAAGSLTAKIYRKTASGAPLLELVTEATGPETWIGSLGWSRDGRHLAAGSAGGSVTIWTSEGFAATSRVQAHERNIDSIAWSPRADLVATSSADASVKVWRSDGTAVATMRARTRAQLAVGWSANSRFIAAGPDDGPVRVWEIESGQIIAALEGEKTTDALLSELWKVPALAQALLRPVAVHRVRALQWSPHADRLAVLATNGSTKIEVWEPLRNRRVSTIDPEVPDARAFAWSPDGRSFAVGSLAKGNAPATHFFGAADGDQWGTVSEKSVEGTDVDVQSLAWSPDGTLLARSGWGLTSAIADLKQQKLIGTGVQGCCVAFSPDGAMLAAGPNLFEMKTRGRIGEIPADAAAAIAWSPDSKRLAIAKGRTVAIYDPISSRTVATLAGHDLDVTGVTWSADSRHVVTSSSDGGLRLWTDSGEMLATLLVLDEGRDWLVVTPDGLFDGSPGAWKLVGWHADSSNYLRVDPVEVFFREYFYPGLLPDLLYGKRPRPQVAIEEVDRRQPVVSFVSPATGAEAASRVLEVEIEVVESQRDFAHAAGSGARDVRLFRNGSLVALWSGDVLKGKSRATLSASIPVVAGENRLTAWAFNSSNIKSEDASLVVVGNARLARRGTMQIVAVALNHYANTDFDLRFARADAEAFAEELKRRQLSLGSLESINVTTLFDSAATREAILDTLRRAGAAAEPEDALVVFFAGHGIAAGSRFHLIPHDLGYTGTRADLDRESFQEIAKHSISDLDLESVFRGAGAERILLVIDACNSGQALESEERRRGPMNSKGLAQLAWEKGMHVVTASQGYQAALESERLGHGLLTYALVEEGVKKGAADLTPRDGAIVVREWLDYAARRVPQLQEQAMLDARAQGREVAFVDGEQTVRDLVRRSLQRPRVFYRRESEREAFVIARP